MDINGVKVKHLKQIPDERGWLTEILRCDDPEFTKFGQVYVTTAYPGVVKAWHVHKKQTDNIACIKGMMKLVLFDNRKDSPSMGNLIELFIGDKNPCLVTVPPGVVHGFKAIGEETAYFLNITDQPYNRDEPDEYRRAANTPDILYDWGLAPWLKHG